MKLYRIKLVLLLAIVGLMTQCREDVQLKFEDFKPKLAVNAQLAPDKTIEISVTSSSSPVSAQSGIIPDNMTVTLQDLTLDINVNLYREAATFIAPFVYPRVGHVYELTASAPGFESIVTQTTIPPTSNVHSATVQDFELTPSSETAGKNNVSYDISIATGKKNSNFLHVLFWQETRLNVGTIETPDFEDYVYVIEPQFPEESGYQPHHEHGVLIDCGNVTATGQYVFSFRDYTIGEFEELGELVVEVRSVSAEYFLYFESLVRQLISREDPFAEPIPTYNNIDNGLGNFSSYHVERFRITLQ